MPRGTKDGSRTYQAAVITEDGSVTRPARILVRKHYTDLKGRSRQKIREAFTEGEADRVQRQIFREIEDELAGVNRKAHSRTFVDLATLCASERQPAEYVGDTKVGGLRSWRTVESQLKPLLKFFGSSKLASITYDDLQEYKRRRLRSITVRGTRRSGSSVARELALARHMLFVAVREGWIADNPFRRGRPLIQTSTERSRGRILTPDDEALLLAACFAKCKHLRLAIVMAIETGMRRGEQLRLLASDIDLEGRLITVRARNSKTGKKRLVPITSRLMSEIEPHMATIKTVHGRVFEFNDPKRAFATVCERAAIVGLHWHDLRHTAITRMVHVYGLSHLDAMKVSGHASWKTFFETYLNPDSEIVRGIGDRIDAARAEATKDLAGATAEPDFAPVSDAVN